MFVRQWLAASEAGALKMYYHDFDRNQSHHIFPLIRRMRHLILKSSNIPGAHGSADPTGCGIN
jgi:hypothetical protein